MSPFEPHQQDVNRGYAHFVRVDAPPRVKRACASLVSPLYIAGPPQMVRNHPSVKAPSPIGVQGLAQELPGLS